MSIWIIPTPWNCPPWKSPSSFTQLVSRLAMAKKYGALVHEIVDQPRVAPDGDSLSRRIEICFRRDCILVVAEVIARVGQQLDQRDAHVGHVSLGPTGDQNGEAVKNQLAKALIILREIVDFRLD